MADDPTTKKTDDPVAAAEFPIGGTVVTGEGPNDDAPMTEVQAATLRQLCDGQDEPFDGNLTRAQAADRIAALGGTA